MSLMTMFPKMQLIKLNISFNYFVYLFCIKNKTDYLGNYMYLIGL